MISNVLNTMSFGSSEVAVRINSVDTEKLALEDMNAFMQGPDHSNHSPGSKGGAWQESGMGEYN